MQLHNHWNKIQRILERWVYNYSFTEWCSTTISFLAISDLTSVFSNTEVTIPPAIMHKIKTSLIINSVCVKVFMFLKWFDTLNVKRLPG